MPKTKNRTLIDSGRIVFLPLGAIQPNPSQPRRVFDSAALQELAASIAQFGVLQPLTDRRTPDGMELVDSAEFARIPVAPRPLYTP